MIVFEWKFSINSHIIDGRVCFQIDEMIEVTIYLGGLIYDDGSLSYSTNLKDLQTTQLIKTLSKYNTNIN